MTLLTPFYSRGSLIHRVVLNLQKTLKVEPKRLRENIDERRKAKIFSYQLRVPHKESGSSHLPNRKNGTERITWELVALEYVGRGKGDV